MRRAAAMFIAVFFLAGCGYDKFGDDFDQDYAFMAPNADISHMRELYGDKSGPVKDNIIIAGYVTADDRSGNFYRTFIIDDGTGAIEVKAGLYNIRNRFPEGRYVAVKARGLTVGSYNGVMEIGMSPETGPYQTDYMPGRGVADKYLFPAARFSHVDALPVHYRDLDETLCGRLVRIGPVVLVQEAEADGAETEQRWTDPENVYSQNTYREFRTYEDETIAVLTSQYASFAREYVPRRSVWLTGILSKGRTDRASDMYILKLRSLDDVENY